MFEEKEASRILQQALIEGRCAMLIEYLMTGGTATIDAGTGKLVLISAEQIQEMWSEFDYG
jgi:hypothetical protein